MFHAFPDEYVRAQLAVGALVLFGVSRVIGAAVGVQRGWRISIGHALLHRRGSRVLLRRSSSTG